MNWSITPGSRLKWHCWENECVLYNDASGSTHMFGAEVTELLHILEESPKSPQQLATEFSSLFEDASPADIKEWLEGVLRQLKDLGLITHCSA